jgi:hypothetical protein
MPDPETFVEPIAQIGRWVFGRMSGNPRPELDRKPVSKTFTDITFILDRSGSMASLREAACRSINDYMRTVDQEPGDGCWTLVQFDDPDSARGAGEAFPHEVFTQVPGERRPFLEVQNFQPRGSTALRDAMATTILRAKARIESQVPEALRPDYRVLMVTMTDGQENASQQYTQAKLNELIAERQKAGWVFVYLGANQDAFAEGKNLGIDQQRNVQNRYRGATFKNYEASPAAMQACTANAAADARDWKAEGNQTAAGLQGDGKPDIQAKLQVKKPGG